MKRLICTALILSLLLAGCGGSDKNTSEDMAESVPELISEPPESSGQESSLPQEDEESSFPDEQDPSSEPEETSEASAEAESSGSADAPAPRQSMPDAASSAAVSSAPAPGSSAAAAALPPSDGGTAMDSVAVQDTGSYLSSVEQQVISLINAERTSLGLSELTYDASLTTAARIRSRELYDYEYFAHARPDGRAWHTVLTVDVPIVYTGAGENIANTEHNYPDRDPAQDASHWYTMWRNSAGHYENMIHPDFTHVGVGIYYIQVGDMVYACATTLFCVY